LADLKNGNVQMDSNEDDVVSIAFKKVKKKPVGGGGKKRGGAATAAPEEFNDLFGDDPTPILGKNRREKLTQIRQYKTLFADELKSFKIKPKATEEELDMALEEIDTIVNCSGVESLLKEAFFSSLNVLENASSKTNSFDFSGLTEALRANPEVHKLLKILAIKYRVFQQAPPEVQLFLITVSTALVMRSQKAQKKRVSSILNSTYIPS
jgi:hypothetical protein